MMEIRHLRYFIAVAELRNFTKAAEASFVAQSALSQQISRLEHELGAPLFVRGKRGAELTPAGELLLPHARRLVADEAWARAEMRSYLGLEKGRLTIGMIQTSASGVDVVGAVAEFSQRYPGIELHIVDQTTAEMIEGVRRGPLDLAVVGIGPTSCPTAWKAASWRWNRWSASCQRSWRTGSSAPSRSRTCSAGGG